MNDADPLDSGREAYARGAWGDAFDRLMAADRRAPLDPDALELVATVAYLTGRHEESVGLWARAHHELLARGHARRAARAAFWLGFKLFQRGDRARGGGWITRARRLLDQENEDCVESGYLLIPAALGASAGGEHDTAYETFCRAADYGARFDDPDLVTMARLGQGQARIKLGDTRGGVPLLDEAMVAVEANEVSPVVAGMVYCAVIELCQEIFDLRRAQEWTAALSGWCEAHPDLVTYRGQCLVRRSEILRLHGAWADAAHEVDRACERLAAPPGEPAAGLAFYQKAELHRLQGEFEHAEAAYREASRWGRKPHPGLALLRLATGDLDAAAAAIRRVADEATDLRTRSTVLPAFVEIMLAIDQLEPAEEAAKALDEIAAQLASPLLRAIADYTRGAVLLAKGDARSALGALRQAWTEWEDLEVPYEAARTRFLIGLACKELDDDDSAALELDAARWGFEKLGAAPDLRRLDELAGLSRDGTSGGHAHGLTPRELQVLRRVAVGATNKVVGGELFISERTVERHLSNIFTKLRVSSRAAATAWAYEHELM
jgi:DNA-binding CsgD family transcriptional regulator/tetratricopeptide (TPR) repeat protein